MNRIVLLLMLVFSGFCFAEMGIIRPVLKAYSAPPNLSKYPLESKINHDLVIYTPIPRAIAPNIGHYLYDSKIRNYIAFSSSNEKDYRMLLDNAFGLNKPTRNDEDTVSFINILKNENSLVEEIDLNTQKYKIFVVSTKGKGDLYKYTVYVLPQTKVNNIIRMITLNRFNKEEAEQILGTLHVIGD